MGDTELIEKLRTDPESGVRELVRLYGRLLYAVARTPLAAVGLGEADIEAVVADTVSEFWLGLESYDPGCGTVRGYLCSMARHNALDCCRSRRPSEPLDEASPDPEPGPEELALESQRRREVLQAVKSLGEPDREIVVRKYYLSQPSARIAETLGMTADNVDVRAHRAVRKLKRLLGEEEHEEL